MLNLSTIFLKDKQRASPPQDIEPTFIFIDGGQTLGQHYPAMIVQERKQEGQNWSSPGLHEFDFDGVTVKQVT